MSHIDLSKELEPKIAKACAELCHQYHWHWRLRWVRWKDWKSYSNLSEGDESWMWHVAWMSNGGAEQHV